MNVPLTGPSAPAVTFVLLRTRRARRLRSTTVSGCAFANASTSAWLALASLRDLVLQLAGVLHPRLDEEFVAGRRSSPSCRCWRRPRRRRPTPWRRPCACRPGPAWCRRLALPSCVLGDGHLALVRLLGAELDADALDVGVDAGAAGRLAADRLAVAGLHRVEVLRPSRACPDIPRYIRCASSQLFEMPVADDREFGVGGAGGRRRRFNAATYAAASASLELMRRRSCRPSPSPRRVAPALPARAFLAVAGADALIEAPRLIRVVERRTSAGSRRGSALMLQLTLALSPATAPTARPPLAPFFCGRPGRLRRRRRCRPCRRLHAALAGGALRRAGAAVGVCRRPSRWWMPRRPPCRRRARRRSLVFLLVPEPSSAVFLRFLGRRDAVAETDVEPSSSPRSTWSCGRRWSLSLFLVVSAGVAAPGPSFWVFELACSDVLPAGGYRLGAVGASCGSRRRGRPRSTLSFTWVVDLPPCDARSW